GGCSYRYTVRRSLSLAQRGAATLRTLPSVSRVDRRRHLAGNSRDLGSQCCCRLLGTIQSDSGDRRYVGVLFSAVPPHCAVVTLSAVDAPSSSAVRKKVRT